MKKKKTKKTSNKFTEIIGMNVIDARSHLGKFKHIMRIVVEDGAQQCVAQTLCPTRINVVVEGGIVVAIDSRG